MVVYEADNSVLDIFMAAYEMFEEYLYYRHFWYYYRLRWSEGVDIIVVM
jgi:hypothetical protein